MRRASQPRRYERTKTARALVAAVIGTVHRGFVPLHAPDHERNRHPLAGDADNCTGTKEGNAAEHFGRHVIPALELRTVPCPDTAAVSR
jgi:hypothetical protein